MVQFFFASAGVAARLGMAAGAHQVTRWDQSVAHRAGSRVKHQAGPEHQAKPKQLDHLAIRHMRERLNLAGGRRRPATNVIALSSSGEMLSECRDAEGFEPPITQGVESADARTPKPAA